MIVFAGLFIFCQNGNSASIIYPPSSENVNSNLTKNDYLKASVFVKLSVKKFAILIRQKLNFLQKLYFKSVQRKLRKELKKDPDVTITQYYDHEKAKFKLDGLWFILGIIVGPFAILFSFTSKQKKNYRISAALGSIVFFLWFGYLFLF